MMIGFEIWKEDRQKWAPKPNEICKSSKKNEDQNIYIIESYNTM